MSLQVNNVSVLLGDGEQQVQALQNVSLQVNGGDLAAVVGPSGAGKSTLLAVCGGLRTPTTGEIRIGGENIASLTSGALTRMRRDNIGFVFQQSNLIPALTAMDQLLLLVHLKGLKATAKDRDRARYLLDRVGMSHRADRRPDQMSGGERQRVGIARALMVQPAVMLVDEPTSMLDQDRGRKIVELLAAQCLEHKVATLMVTHDATMLAAATHVFSIRDGRLETKNSV